MKRNSPWTFESDSTNESLWSKRFWDKSGDDEVIDVGDNSSVGGTDQSNAVERVNRWEEGWRPEQKRNS